MMRRIAVQCTKGIVKHNGHTFQLKTTHRKQYGDVNPWGSFYCKVCGLSASAEKNGNAWKEWHGEGAEIHCGVMLAKQVMDS